MEDFDPIAGRRGTVKPVLGTAGETRSRVLETTFGNGYTQRIADGLNHLQQFTTVRWTHKTEEQWHQVRDFLRPKLGTEVFLYTEFGESTPRKWVCTELKGPVPEHGNLYTFSAKFREEFGE